jgi:ADP-ribose pyrophosphatase
MYTIIIGHGLTENVLNPEVQYSTLKSSAGIREINRLMGQGRHYGEGPLPTFLKNAETLSKNSEEIGIILLKDKSNVSPGTSDSLEPDSYSFVAPIRAIVENTFVIDSFPDTVPCDQIIEAIRTITAIDPLSPEMDRTGIRFILVGCHTEKQILTTGVYVRNILGFSHVSVSSHLTGSSAWNAHYAALRHTLPANGINVLLDFAEAMNYAGMPLTGSIAKNLIPCQIEPPEVLETLNNEQKKIIELLCIHWTKACLKPLGGGFSGSLLFIAEGWKDQATTEPMVIKLDRFKQMRLEIDGYHEVKDFLGKHIPTFGYPIAAGDFIGVGMELAAMEGNPETLQDAFENADTEGLFNRFLGRFEKSLSIIANKLYKNTCHFSWFSPYRRLDLHTEKQIQYLDRNIKIIEGYLAEANNTGLNIDMASLPKLLGLIAANEDSIESELCITHGDMHFQNIICDQMDNIWFIDWTHAGKHMLELDFAKLECFVKFVFSKQFDLQDIPHLRQFEEYLLSHRIPSTERSLPESLKFAKWDLRYRKILTTVNYIREACFSLKRDECWIAYRTSLLKYSLQSLSFDKRRGKGQCELPQLAYALVSVELLIFDLISDDFHLKIRGERPGSYPARHRISIDEAPWSVDSLEYSPPYYVDPHVLENDYTVIPGGWADPEDVKQVHEDLESAGVTQKDEYGRPLHPRGRTGIAGRGLLGRWGPNPAVCAIVLKTEKVFGKVHILLGRTKNTDTLTLPKSFLMRNELPETAIARTLENECGWRPISGSGEIIFQGYNYDPRQTDHAWAELNTYLFLQGVEDYPAVMKPGDSFDEVIWLLLDPDSINHVPSWQALFIRDAIRHLRKTGQIQDDSASGLLSDTGGHVT